MKIISTPIGNVPIVHDDQHSQTIKRLNSIEGIQVSGVELGPFFVYMDSVYHLVATKAGVETFHKVLGKLCDLFEGKLPTRLEWEPAMVIGNGDFVYHARFVCARNHSWACMLDEVLGQQEIPLKGEGTYYLGDKPLYLCNFDEIKVGTKIYWPDGRLTKVVRESKITMMVFESHGVVTDQLRDKLGTTLAIQLNRWTTSNEVDSILVDLSQKNVSVIDHE